MLALLSAVAAPNLVVITMDTTRADALGCYGALPDLMTPRPSATPNLDALAASGARFERFFAHAPTTLSSHASLFTGLDPHGHAVPRNGFPLPLGIPTLAERLSAAGYDTLAVVGAKALESDMGLDRGFRRYDDKMSVTLGPMAQDRAEGVLARTQAVLAERDVTRPLFLWVHFYDPHGPYRAPGDWYGRFVSPDYDGAYADPMSTVRTLRLALRDQIADPVDIDQFAARYLGEVAYMDHHIGLLLQDLDQAGVLDDAVVVATADHGEVLSEERFVGWSHGRTTGDGVIRVPLIVAGPTVEPGTVVARTVGMSGLGPSIEGWMGLEPSLGQRRAFHRIVEAGPVWDVDGWPERPTFPVFSEATQPAVDNGDGWNNAHARRSVRVGGAGIRRKDATDHFLGDRDDRGDPRDDPFGSLLGNLVDSWDVAAPGWRDVQMDDETLDALRALGYIAEPADGAAP